MLFHIWFHDLCLLFFKSGILWNLYLLPRLHLWDLLLIRTFIALVRMEAAHWLLTASLAITTLAPFFDWLGCFLPTGRLFLILPLLLLFKSWTRLGILAVIDFIQVLVRLDWKSGLLYFGSKVHRHFVVCVVAGGNSFVAVSLVLQRVGFLARTTWILRGLYWLLIRNLDSEDARLIHLQMFLFTLLGRWGLFQDRRSANLLR